MTMIPLSILFIAVSSMILRTWIRWPRRDFGVDTWYFLNYAEGMRRQKRLPVHLPHYLLDIEEQWYPPFVAFLVALFSKRIADQYHWMFSAIIDTLHGLLLYAVTYWVTHRYEIAFSAALLYATGTFNASMATNLNARSTANLVFTLLMVFLYCAWMQRTVISVVALMLCGAILLHTHKTSVQQFLFIIAGLTFIYRDIFFIGCLAGIVATAFVITGGFYRKILCNHVQIIRYWSKNLPYLWQHQVYASPLYANAEKARRKKGVAGVKKNKVMYFLARGQLVLSLIIVVVWWLCKSAYPVIPGANFFFYWISINYIAILTTSYLPLFKNIGEGYNYVLYGIFPMSILLACALGVILPDIRAYAAAVSVLVALNLMIQISTLWRQFDNTNSFVDDELKEIIRQLRAAPRDGVMCLPVFKAEPVAYLAQKKVLWGGHGGGWDKLNEFYPLLRTPLEELIRRYGLSYILIDKRFVDFEDTRLHPLVKVLYDGAHYLLAEVV